MDISVQAISLVTRFLISGINSTLLVLPIFLGGVSFSLNSKIFVIISAKINWKYVNIIHDGKYPDECISSFFDNYITFSFPLCM